MRGDRGTPDCNSGLAGFCTYILTDTTNGVIDWLLSLFNPAALWIHADKGGVPMSATAGGRDDYDALTLRGLARTSEDLHQARRLLSLACVYDGMSRADTAKGGGVARQSLRDRGHRFNEAGPEGLFDHRAPRPRWLNLLRSSKPAPALSMTLEHEGGGPLETT